MIEISTLITYVLVVLGFVFIPGPATLLTVARASTSGTRSGLATGAGIAVGDVLHTLLAAIGISAVIAASAALFSIIKYLGAAYLIYLGITALLSKSEAPERGARVAISASQAFRQAVLAELLNPKTALFFLAFLPQFVDPGSGLVAVQLMIFGVIFALLGFVSTAFFAVTSGSLGEILRRNPTVLRWQARIVGSIYIGLGLRLGLQEP